MSEAQGGGLIREQFPLNTTGRYGGNRITESFLLLNYVLSYRLLSFRLILRLIFFLYF